jgi:hypothetical protein
LTVLSVHINLHKRRQPESRADGRSRVLNNTATAVVFEKPGSWRFAASDSVSPRPRLRRRGSLERYQYRYRAPALGWPHAGIPRPRLSPGARLRVRRPRRRDRRRCRLEVGTLVFAPGSPGYTDVRGLFGASAERLVVSSASFPSTNPSVSTAPAGAGRHGLSRRHAHQRRRASRADHRSRCARSPAGALHRRPRRAAPTVWETNPQRLPPAPRATAPYHPDEDRAATTA